MAQRQLKIANYKVDKAGDNALFGHWQLMPEPVIQTRSRKARNDRRMRKRQRVRFAEPRIFARQQRCFAELSAKLTGNQTEFVDPSSHVFSGFRSLQATCSSQNTQLSPSTGIKEGGTSSNAGNMTSFQQDEVIDDGKFLILSNKID